MRTRDARKLASKLADSLFYTYDNRRADRLVLENPVGCAQGSGWSYAFAVDRLAAVLIAADRKKRKI